MRQTPCTHPLLDTQKWDTPSKKHRSRL